VGTELIERMPKLARVLIKTAGDRSGINNKGRNIINKLANFINFRTTINVKIGCLIIFMGISPSELPKVLNDERIAIYI